MLNTQRIIDTLRGAPCEWRQIKSSVINRHYLYSPEARATLVIHEQTATMQCVFSPDLPEHITVRNMNCLLVFVAAAGAPDAIPWLTDTVRRCPDKPGEYSRKTVKNRIHCALTIDKQRSITTVTIRPCKARVYDTA